MASETVSARADRPEGPRRVGRPRGAGAFDTDELLERALDALARGGYRALSMRGLARELGVSLASVQHRFGTKDELWRAAVDHALRTDLSADDIDIARALRTRLQLSADRPGLFLALFNDDAPGSDSRHEYLAARVAPVLAAGRRTIADADDAGLLRPVDVDALAAFMMVVPAALASIPAALLDALGLPQDPTGRLADGVADVVLHGVLRRGPLEDVRSDGQPSEP